MSSKKKRRPRSASPTKPESPRIGNEGTGGEVSTPQGRRKLVWGIMGLWLIATLAIISGKIFPAFTVLEIPDKDIVKLALILIAIMVAASWKLENSHGYALEAKLCKGCVALLGMVAVLIEFDPSTGGQQIQLSTVVMGLWLFFALYALTSQLNHWLCWAFWVGTGSLAIVVAGILFTMQFGPTMAIVSLDPVKVIATAYVLGMVMVVTTVFFGKQSVPG